LLAIFDNLTVAEPLRKLVATMRVPVASMMPASTLPLTAISPTSVEPVVTAAVDIDRGLLLARQAQGIDEVCGYVSGDNSTFTAFHPFIELTWLTSPL